VVAVRGTPAFRPVMLPVILVVVRGTLAWECDIWIQRTDVLKVRSRICKREEHLYGDFIVDFTNLL